MWGHTLGKCKDWSLRLALSSLASALLNPPHCTPFCEFWGRALIAKEYKPQEQNPEPQK